MAPSASCWWMISRNRSSRSGDMLRIATSSFWREKGGTPTGVSMAEPSGITQDESIQVDVRAQVRFPVLGKLRPGHRLERWYWGRNQLPVVGRVEADPRRSAGGFGNPGKPHVHIHVHVHVADS